MLNPDYLEINIPSEAMVKMSGFDCERVEALVQKGLETGLITKCERFDTSNGNGFCTTIRLWGDFSAIKRLLPGVTNGAT
jgi:hypothetical protein